MILVDLDNILADFEPHYRALINEMTGRSARREDIVEYSYAASLGLSPKESAAVWTRFNESDGWSALPPISGARRFMERLRRLDKIAIVTNRPETARDSTLAWLREHGMEHDELHVTENPSKRAFVDGLGWMPRLVVEDAPHHAEEFSAAGVPIVLVDYPWNRKCRHDLLTRVRDLGEAIDAARSILRDTDRVPAGW